MRDAPKRSWLTPFRRPRPASGFGLKSRRSRWSSGKSRSRSKSRRSLGERKSWMRLSGVPPRLTGTN